MSHDPTEDPSRQYRDGVAGASARAEHQRRRDRREERARAKLGTTGVVIARVTGDPQSTRAWVSGTAGEERVGRLLDAAAGPALRVLHDRRIPGTRANIDHLVITPQGVHVVDAKRYVGQRPERRTSKPFGFGEELLFVGGRNRTSLVEGALKQAARVRTVVGPQVPVLPVLCFVEGDWPLIARPFDVAGVRVTYPRALVKDLDAPGPLSIADTQSLQQVLTVAFPGYIAS